MVQQRIQMEDEVVDDLAALELDGVEVESQVVYIFSGGVGWGSGGRVMTTVNTTPVLCRRNGSEPFPPPRKKTHYSFDRNGVIIF